MLCYLARCVVFAIEAAGLLGAHVFGVAEVHFKALLWELVSAMTRFWYYVVPISVFLCPIFWS